VIPVHVVISNNPEVEARYGEPFAGAIALYRFESNVEAFERLTSAQSPIDMLVITPAQNAMFNMTAEQMVARLLESTWATSPTLSGLRIVVVGEQLQRQHPRLACVSTLDAAVRLVKFGEIESAPTARPRAAAPAPVVKQPASTVTTSATGRGFADSVISSIWAAGDEAAERQVVVERTPVRRQAVSGGGPIAQHSTPVADDLIVPDLSGSGGMSPLFAGRGDVSLVSAEAMNSGPVIELQPAQSYELPGRGVYRANTDPYGMMQYDGTHAPVQVHAQPVQGQAQPVQAAVPVPSAAAMTPPPQLVQQVGALVYGAQSQADPILGFSQSVQQQLAMQRAGGAAPMVPLDPAMAANVAQAVAAPAAAAPVSAVAAPPMALSAHQIPAQPPGGGVSTFEASNDLLARASGGVSFG
jgi:hypothetical protein